MLAEANALTRSRLLALYPVSALKDKWPDQKKKDAAIEWGAQNVELTEIKQFLGEYFSCCKQHIYLFSHQTNLNHLPRFRLPDAEKVSESGDQRHLLYLAEVTYHVVFTDPLGEDPTEELTKKKLHELLARGDSQAAGIIQGAIEEFSQEFALVIRRFLRL